MKKILSRLLAGFVTVSILVVLLAPTAQAQRRDLWTLVSGTYARLNVTTWELGASASRIAKGWFDDIDSTIATIGTVTTGALTIDVTDTEAFLVRKNGDTGDVFAVDTDTANPTLTIGDRTTLIDDGVTFSITPAAGDYTSFGGETTSHSLTNDGDIVASGIEANGRIWADANMTIAASTWVDLLGSIEYNTNITSYGGMTRSTDDGWKFVVGAGANTGNHNVLFVSSDVYTKDFDHETKSTDPTAFIHSVLDPDTDNGEYLGWSYLGLQGGTMETDRVGFDLTIKSVAPFATATGTNRDGKDIILQTSSPTNSGTIYGVTSVGVEASSHGINLVADSFYVAGQTELEDDVFIDGDLTLGGDYNMNFPIDLGTDPGFVYLFDSDITSAGAAADDASVLMTIDHELYFELHGENDGSGNLQNQYIRSYKRFETNQGADVASATNLVLGNDGNVFEITGTTKIDLISNLGWNNGSEITLICNESVTIDDGTATSSTNITLVLAGGADFSCTADDILTLVLGSTTASGQAWFEKSRSAN